MRILMLHVDHFSSTITEKGRSKIVENPLGSKTTIVDEALIILTSVEKQDELNPDTTAEKAVDEMAKLATQLKVKVIVLHPFAHLFAEMSSPEVALKTLKLTEEGLTRRSFNVVRTPFGWFNSLEIKAKGHPLSRIARIISSS
jgi:threonyl-tRNA synthetase